MTDFLEAYRLACIAVAEQSSLSDPYKVAQAFIDTVGAMVIATSRGFSPEEGQRWRQRVLELIEDQLKEPQRCRVCRRVDTKKNLEETPCGKRLEYVRDECPHKVRYINLRSIDDVLLWSEKIKLGIVDGWMITNLDYTIRYNEVSGKVTLRKVQ